MKIRTIVRYLFYRSSLAFFEKLVYDQFRGFLNVNKLLFSQQSSFRPLHSVLTCLLKCTYDWYFNLEKSEYTTVLFIDLKEIRCFRSYLADRKQCCKVNWQLSDLQIIKTGVPQCSCLGPLLFIICGNDLHSLYDIKMLIRTPMTQAFLSLQSPFP